MFHLILLQPFLGILLVYHHVNSKQEGSLISFPSHSLFFFSHIMEPVESADTVSNEGIRTGCSYSGECSPCLLWLVAGCVYAISQPRNFSPFLIYWHIFKSQKWELNFVKLFFLTNWYDEGFELGLAGCKANACPALLLLCSIICLTGFIHFILFFSCFRFTPSCAPVYS